MSSAVTAGPRTLLQAKSPCVRLRAWCCQYNAGARERKHSQQNATPNRPMRTVAAYKGVGTKVVHHNTGNSFRQDVDRDRLHEKKTLQTKVEASHLTHRIERERRMSIHTTIMDIMIVYVQTLLYTLLPFLFSECINRDLSLKCMSFYLIPHDRCERPPLLIYHVVESQKIRILFEVGAKKFENVSFTATPLHRKRESRWRRWRRWRRQRRLWFVGSQDEIPSSRAKPCVDTFMAVARATAVPARRPKVLVEIMVEATWPRATRSHRGRGRTAKHSTSNPAQWNPPETERQSHGFEPIDTKRIGDASLDQPDYVTNYKHDGVRQVKKLMANGT